ncbi:o-succinylbenzoate synthase [Epilithonimonas lactis]|uniref:Mandelate racemase n=1 Tax=Epilithonimonas lactis TaxID=421072 RepID=A0A085BFM1_9FLAO|nr:o-succinylbenzoate synthase [Epilithonimonas lactis]KFC21266.1 mandelate racemase [Epilithonimonas lactis]SEP79124.1 o-succinylbenzoate synthase [Epilithonimonas lactis]
MKTATFNQYILNFKQPSGTSRGILNTKETYFIEITEDDKKGIGECALFRGLSFDDDEDYEAALEWACRNINLSLEELKEELVNHPSIIFGIEQALANLKHQGNLYFPSDFTEGKDSIKINGLIWMGNAAFMQSQIQEKLKDHFTCIKLKIGVDWQSEKEVIKSIRNKFPKEQIELRVDANGAFSPEQAKLVLEELAELEIHSIEQPIQAGNWKAMAELCKNTPTPIALDEELIGVLNIESKKELLKAIKPQYIILKPSLIGGFSGSDEWIDLAEKNNIDWWITSALESNIGLNAIAQYTYNKKNPMPQGLGTGGLFTNNFPSPLILKGENLWFKN